MITLGVIGIVAAMTLPTVLKTYERKEAETRLQKAYSVISQAFLAAQAKHGEARYWTEWETPYFILKNYIAPEIRGAKVYEGKSFTGAMCFENRYVGNHGSGKTQYSWLTGVHISNPFYDTTASIKLTDGTCIGINPASDGVYHTTHGGIIFIDINGADRLPNVAGKDLFMFRIVDNAIKPLGYDWKLKDLSTSSVNNSCHHKAFAGGMVCAAKIMQDGWKIKYW